MAAIQLLLVATTAHAPTCQRRNVSRWVENRAILDRIAQHMFVMTVIRMILSNSPVELFSGVECPSGFTATLSVQRSALVVLPFKHNKAEGQVPIAAVVRVPFQGGIQIQATVARSGDHLLVSCPLEPVIVSGTAEVR